MKSKLAAIAVLAVAGCVTFAPAHAGFSEWLNGWFTAPPVDYGRWLCTDCALVGPTAGDNGEWARTEPADILAYIKAYNSQIHASKNERVHRWIPASVITICNGTTCQPVEYQASGVWLPRVGPLPDSGAPYKGSGKQGTFYGPPAPGQMTPYEQSLIDPDFIGPVPRFDAGAEWNITARYVPPPEYGPTPGVGTGRWLTPSITLIQGDLSYTAVGTPFFQSPPEQVGSGIGNMLGWTDAAYGLEGGYGTDFGTGGGGCGRFAEVCSAF